MNSQRIRSSSLSETRYGSREAAKNAKKNKGNLPQEHAKDAEGASHINRMLFYLSVVGLS
jgi:hypothetical protein